MKKHIVTFVLTLVIGFVASAQDHFKTHAVKEGETVEQIAKMYSVTPYNILKLNPEIKSGLKPNTILIIPVGDVAVPETKDVVTTTNVDPLQQEVERFIKHKVRKKETLYGLAQKYNVSEAVIKRYNSQLYSRTPMKGEKLDIPVFKKIPVKEDNGLTNGLVPYLVKASEGKWRIAYEHGITEAKLLELNPEMKEILQEGDTLMVPFIAGNDMRMVDSDEYNYYTVQEAEGFYRLNVKLGLTQDQIEMLNPEVKEVGLQKGMILKIPKEVTGDFTVSDGRLVEKFSLLDSLNYDSVSRIAIVLPLDLGSLDYDSIPALQSRLMHTPGKSPDLLELGVDFYSGVLVALDSARDLGLSVDAKVFDSGKNENRIYQLLSSGQFADRDAIVGPIIPNSINQIADYAGMNVPVFPPFTYKGINLKYNVFQTLPPDELLRRHMIDYMVAHGADKNIIIIADKEHEAVQKELQAKFPGAKIVNPKDESIIRLDDINPFLTAEKKNWVIVETDNFSLLYNITTVVNSARTEEFNIRMLTTLRGKAYDNSNIQNISLSNLNFIYPSPYNPAIKENSFAERYQKRFGALPNRYATRGFDLVMDLLLRLGYNKNLYYVNSRVSEMEYVENKFDYRPSTEGGYYNRAMYIVTYDNLEIKEVKDDTNLYSEVPGGLKNGMRSPQK
ncbi:PBP1 and LysM peptidoglycan-binding domain-containing protein [Robertkochia solimangrovi]|uniref:PBP1 and LysM peptidoglycan-binding domain-containing protein n=1 Tax=Robertkochia solimangrovi TaxID=2213046 RepID=UPI00117D7EC7|nr:LysM peptidoglycan-binding domain-containing protein [Robertkochia solimangrovi]TRZ41838.1 branched-chain amino acid ABC transporter substrate-binding protein [Robertkochia solimangrovi]